MCEHRRRNAASPDARNREEQADQKGGADSALALIKVSECKKESGSSRGESGAGGGSLDSGEGEAAVQAWIAKNARRRSGFQGVMRVRQQVNPITREELDAVADTWVDCALRLEDRDLRMMSRVVRAQMERMDAAAAAAAADVAAPGIAFAAG